MGCHALLQGLFQAQKWNLHLLYCRWILCCWPPEKLLLGWIRAKKKQNAVPTSFSTLLPHSRCFRETRPREQVGNEGGREAQPLPGSVGAAHSFQVPFITARDMAPHFGTVPIRSTRSLAFPSFFVVKNYLCLPLSWSVCPTLLHCWWALAQGPSLGDIWGKPLSRPKVEGMCKLNGWPRWSSA